MESRTQFKQGGYTTIRGHASTVRTYDSGNQAKQGALSSPIASDEPNGCSLMDLKGNIVQHQVASLVFSSRKPIQNIILKAARQKRAVIITLRDIFKLDHDRNGFHLFG